MERAGADASRPDDLPEGLGLSAAGYRLSPAQAQAILDLRLHRLTSLEQDKIVKEYGELLDKIKVYREILADPDKLQTVIREELEEIRENFADARRTEIVEDYSDLTIEDLIPEEDLVVTLSRGGYAKAQPVADYQAQRRGGRGKAAARVKGEDFIDQLFVANSHDTLLCFSSRGKVYWLKVYQLPQAGRGSRGKPMVNLLPLEEDERINAVLPVRAFDENKFVFMATSQGTVKKTSLASFSRPRSSGIIALDLRGGDFLVGAGITDGNSELMLFASSGKAIRFQESDVRPMGRSAAGVRGIRLADPGDEVIALRVLQDGPVLVGTEHGYGKRTALADFPTQGRGGQGVIAIQTTDRNGRLVGALQAADDDEIMLISSGGTLVRTRVADVSVQGRNTQGVRLIRLDEGDRLVGLERIQVLADTEDAEAQEDEAE